MTTFAEHPFVAPPNQPWARCVTCHLSEAQHLVTTALYPAAVVGPYRCPYCVHIGADVCTHREAPLGMDATPIERESA